MRGAGSAAARAIIVALALLLPAIATTAVALPVIFVDNRASAPEEGTHDHPFVTITQAERAAGFGAVIYVAESDKPYLEGVTLKQGQKLIGSGCACVGA